MPVRFSDTTSKAIMLLHDTYGLSFREIASVSPYDTIPAGTLWAIANGYPIPNKHRKALGLPPLVKVRADMVRKSPPQPPRNLTRCTIYPGTPTADIIDKLRRVTGKTFELKEGE